MIDLELTGIETLTLTGSGRLAGMDVLSPFVWRDGVGGYEMLLRAAPHREDALRQTASEIWYGRSPDGLDFEMDSAPTLVPGPDPADIDGCEDPTVIVDQGTVHAWYSGWNQRRLTDCLLHAAGPDARHLTKRGVALKSAGSYRNPKEATVVACADGRWRLLFEFARGDASKMGCAVSDDLAGSWKIEGVALAPRRERFDSWHLSPGPIIRQGSDGPIMLYNGADQDARWRIGWVQFDARYRKVVDRCEEPLIAPGDLEDGTADIAFAASVLEFGDRIWLYYSIGDMLLRRATLTLRSSPNG